MTNIEINKDSLAIVVNPDGELETYIPKEGGMPWQQIHAMLKGIRKFELIFSELVNKTHGKKNEEVSDL